MTTAFKSWCMGVKKQHQVVEYGGKQHEVVGYDGEKCPCCEAHAEVERLEEKCRIFGDDADSANALAARLDEELQDSEAEVERLRAPDGGHGVEAWRQCYARIRPVYDAAIAHHQHCERLRTMVPPKGDKTAIYEATAREFALHEAVYNACRAALEGGE